jgi:hypothetical protein
MTRRMSRDEFDAWEARVDDNLLRMHELAQKAVAEHNATLPPDAEPWPDRVPPPVRGATGEQERAWRAQVDWDIRLVRELAEKAQAELDRKKRDSDAA